jgi:Ser/Thr protein kinase RdoA (MazF antagonist)
MDGFSTSLQPLAGGHSGETFLAEVAGELTVVRVYGARSAGRGPLAPEIDAAVLELVRGLLPVPDVLEVRRGDPDVDLPGLLVTSRLPGERLDLVLSTLEPGEQGVVGAHLGTVLGRLAHMAQPRAGYFRDRNLAVQDLPDEARDLAAWVGAHSERLAAVLDEGLVGRLRGIAADAQDLLDEDRRKCLVQGDFNAQNLLVDPATLEVTGVIDWELAMAGSPYADLGNLLRFERSATFVDAVLAAYGEFLPALLLRGPGDLLDRARAADLFALVQLASREDEHEDVVRASALLEAVARSGDLHAAPV